MIYTDDEIIKSWNNCFNRKKQIKILSELNACDESDIIRILKKHGYIKEVKKVCKPRKYHKFSNVENEFFSNYGVGHTVKQIVERYEKVFNRKINSEVCRNKLNKLKVNYKREAEWRNESN